MIGYKRLSTIGSFELSKNDLWDSSKDKVISTAKYSLLNSETQNKKNVINRCISAILAEQKVAEHMLGQVMDIEVDFDDPFTYAFDVLSSYKFGGARIEVKTHQSLNKWVNVNIDKENTSGHMNLYHFINYNVADYIIIFNTEELSNKKIKFDPIFIGNRNEIKNITKKSLYGNSYYLDI